MGCRLWDRTESETTEVTYTEAKEVCIINGAQKIERQSTKYVLKGKKGGGELSRRKADPPDSWGTTGKKPTQVEGRSLSHF